MTYFIRDIIPSILATLKRGKSILLLGPRQAGKTTFTKELEVDLAVNLIKPRVRLRYENDPSQLADEIEALAEKCEDTPLIVIDEIQKVPELMDVTQDLIDNNIAKFVLTGSSSRKLKRNSSVNLLPGRVIPYFMPTLTWHEMANYTYSLEDSLIYGTLPEIVLAEDRNEREELLDAYVSIYLEEEVRSEALVRNLSHFTRFLELAANESGNSVNQSKLSQEIGVSRDTIVSYYQILEDCLIADRIEAYTTSRTRKKLSKAPKYLFFDMGVRRVAAKEGTNPTTKHFGHLLEQAIGLEILNRIKIMKKRWSLHYWRDHDGAEVDWLIRTEDKLIPIEVKWTDKPSKKDTRHLAVFLSEYSEANTAYVICQVPRRTKLADNIYAIPWQDTYEIIK